MLTYAIGFIQSTQLLCFALVFAIMAIRDRHNRTIRWTAFAYLAGLIGGVLQLGEHIFPAWASTGLFLEAAPAGYACLHAGLVGFTGRGGRTRWISIAVLAASLPFYLLWCHPGQMARSEALADLVLAVQTSLTAWLLFSTHDPETAWPRRTMAGFFSLYAAVEWARVLAFLLTHKTPELAAPWVEIASGMVYVIAASVLPLAVIWMIHDRLHARMDRETVSDALTQLLNRRGIQAALEHELARYARSGVDFCVVLIDIDHFKRLNDSFGHAGGDLVLREAAALLKSLLRETDTIGRLGGEEFVLLLPNTQVRGAQLLVDRLRLTLQLQNFHMSQRDARITASFGITSSFARPTLTWDDLLQEADIALYAAKHAGRNRAEVFPFHPLASEFSAFHSEKDRALQTA